MMNRLGVLMKARNEGWRLPFTLRAAAAVGDTVVFVDHASSDDTPDVCREVARGGHRIIYVRWDDPVFREMAIYQCMLDYGRWDGCTHFITLDADEAVCANHVERVREFIFNMPPERAMGIPFLSMWDSMWQYRCDPASIWSNRVYPIAWRDDGRLFYRVGEGQYDWHARFPKGWEGREQINVLDKVHEGGVMHYAWTNMEHIAWKAAWYKMTEWVRFPGRNTAAKLNDKYDRVLDKRGIRFGRVKSEWVEPYKPWMKLMKPEPRPWFLDEVACMIDEYGLAHFDGLDLHDANEAAKD